MMVAVGVAATAVSVTFVAGSDVLANPHPNAAAGGLAVALCTAVGAYTWWQRPGSRLGVLVVGIGLSFSVTSLMALAAPVPFTLGRVATAGFVVFTVYVFICFPRDRLTPGPAAWFVHALVPRSSPRSRRARAMSPLRNPSASPSTLSSATPTRSSSSSTSATRRP